MRFIDLEKRSASTIEVEVNFPQYNRKLSMRLLECLLPLALISFNIILTPAWVHHHHDPSTKIFTSISRI